MSDEEKKTFDPFELCVAVMMGIGALGAAWASYEGGLWGGNMATAYGEAANQYTQAAADYNEQVADINHDYHVDMEAKRCIMEAIYTEDEDEKEKFFELAEIMYTSYMTETAYKALGFPENLYQDTPKAKALEEMPREILVNALEKEFDDKYIDAMVAEAMEDFEVAEARFKEGGQFNTTGDRFSLDGVIYTVGLFFAGIATVFKSQVRWILLGLAGFVLSFATFYLFSIPWA